MHIVGFRGPDLVAAYQLPDLIRNGGRLESSGDGYFATEPQGQGIGKNSCGIDWRLQP